MRARSSKLLSGASVLAVVAALAASDQAFAAQIQGPQPSDAFINDGVANNVTTFLSIDTTATVYEDTTPGVTLGDSFYNSLSMSSAVAALTVDNSYLAGAVHNVGSMTSTGANAIAIQANSQVDGGIWNEGVITGNGYGVFIDTNSSIDKGFLNDGTITGVVGGVMLGAGSDINGGVTNNGLISGAIGFDMNGANSELRGGIVNNQGASIVGTGTAAISLSGAGSQLKNGIVNSGLIEGQGAAEGVSLTDGTITGGITNNKTGVIRVLGVTNTAVLVNGATFTGDISNSGQILAAPAGGWGILIAGTTVYTGDITNTATGVISAASHAVQVNNATFTGDVVNQGQITSTTSGDGIRVMSTGFTGNIDNQTTGKINAAVDGVHIGGAGSLTGGVTNAGAITANDDGVEIENGKTVTGVLNNSGTIIGDNNASGTGDGVNVDGQITGGITNSGTIRSTINAINASAADAATVITQTGGLIQGNNGAVTTALNLNNGFADTFNGNGGQLDGNVTAAGGDNFIMGPTGQFAYLRGTATGLNQFDMTGSGAAVLGANLRGAVGTGVTVNAATMALSGSGRVYLDDDTTVNLTGAYTQTGGTVEFQLTSNTTPGNYGKIDATLGGANLGGNIAAYVQGNTFASVGGNTFTYQDVIVGATGATTFANAAAIETSSIFFDGVALVNANDVDIVLTRQSFASALSLPGLSQNQTTMGGVLDSIYNAGGFSPDFTNLYNYLLSLPVGSEAEAARIYDELAGAEHAGLQEIGLRASNAFGDAVGERLDDMVGPATSKSAALGLRRYAASEPTVADDGATTPPRPRDALATSLWGRVYGAWSDADGDAEAAGYDQDVTGFAGGVDFLIDAAWRLGGAIGWSSTDVEFTTAGDQADLDAFQFAGYGLYQSGRIYADAVMSFGFHDIATTRLLTLGFTTEVASADYDANTFGLRGEFGGVWNAGRLDIQPYVGLAYATSSTDGFAETGAGPMSLLVAKSDADNLASTVGVRFSGSWQAGGVRLVPNAEVAWRHEFLDERQAFTAAFLEEPTAQFQIVSTAISRDSAVVGAGLGAQVTKNLVLFLDYDGLYNGTINTHAASAGLRASW